MNLSIYIKRYFIFYSIIIYVAIFLNMILEHYSIFVISTKYLVELATILMLIPVLESPKETIRNYTIQRIFLILIGYMILISILNTDKTSAVFEYDLFTFLRFYIALVIGFRREYFNTIKNALMLFLLFGIFFNFYSLFTADTFIRAYVEEKTLAYKLQYMLLPGFYYLMFYQELDKNEKRIVLISVFFYALEQILFQKRLPTVRVFVCLIFFLYSINLFAKGQLKIISLISKVVLILLVFFVFSQLLTSLGFNIAQYSELLFERFYISDTIEETFNEDTRWLIGESFYESLHQSGHFFSGRGIGGVVYDNTFLMSDESGRLYRSASEMGIPTIILKGGFPLLFFFGFLLMSFILKYKKATKNIYLFANWSTVIIWFIFLYAEGFIGNNSSPFEILLAYSIGFVLSNPTEFRIKKMIKSDV